MAQKQSEQNGKPIQTNETQDISVLQSQVVFLLKEQGKLSAALEVINKKDTRISELENMNTRVQAEYKKHLQETNLLIQSLLQQLQQKNTLIQNLCQQLTNQQAQTENSNVRLQYQQLQVSFNKIVNDYKDLVDTFDAFRAQTQERIHLSQAVPKQTLEEINQLKAQVIAANKALAQRDETIEALKQKVSAAKETSDEVMVYKCQAEQYKKDFEEEREARTKLKDEKIKLKEEFKTLQVHNQALTEQIEGYNQHQITDIKRRLRTGGPHSAAEIKDDEYQSFQQFDCPTCNEKFPDLDTLQLHIQECLDKNG